MKYYDSYNWGALYDEYVKGKTLERLCLDHGIAKTTIMTYFKKLDFKTRPRKGTKQLIC